MTVSEIIQKQKEIYTLLAERRLKESFEKLNLLVTPLQDWQSTDKLNEMETSYRYMIQYMLDGAEDPERKKIYDQLVISSYRLTDPCHRPVAYKRIYVFLLQPSPLSGQPPRIHAGSRFRKMRQRYQ